MFFVIAGVQPRTRILDDAPQRCPRCGLHQARTQRLDHYFSLFFVPLIRIRKGQPHLFCRHCKQPVNQEAAPRSADPAGRPDGQRACTRCGRTLDPAFAYCPFCGQRR